MQTQRQPIKPSFIADSLTFIYLSGTDKILQERATKTGDTSGLHLLIRQCIAQDRQAQKQLYDQYAPLLFTIIKRYVFTQAPADEMLNDTFYKIFTNIEKYEFKGSFEGWMRRIAINCITDYFRKYIKKEPAYKTDIDIVDVQVEEDAAGRLGYKELLQLIYQLPDTQRAVFNLFVFEQLSHKEIAEELGLNENNCRWYLNDARKRLKEKITTSM